MRIAGLVAAMLVVSPVLADECETALLKEKKQAEDLMEQAQIQFSQSIVCERWTGRLYVTQARSSLERAGVLYRMDRNDAILFAHDYEQKARANIEKYRTRIANGLTDRQAERSCLDLISKGHQQLRADSARLMKVIEKTNAICKGE